MKNSKTTKRVLFTNIISLVMCVAMLMGTTFAWFTDSATTKVNTINAGNLKVGLEMETTPGNWDNAEKDPLSFKVPNGTTTILWEPGASFELTPLRVVNNGKLALKYKLMITGVTGDTEMAEVIDVYTKGDSGLTLVGNLKTLLTTGGTIDEGAVSVTEKISSPHKLVFKMNESAMNEYQDKTLTSVSVTVVATQDTVESDSYNTEYDINAEYTIPGKDIQTIIANNKYTEFGGNVLVDQDELMQARSDAKTGIVQSNNGVIDGNLKTLFVEGANTTWDSGIYSKGGTIKNLTINGAFRGILIEEINGSVVIDNVTIDKTCYTLNVNGEAKNDGEDRKLIVSNSTLNGWTSYGDLVTEATFTDCNFGRGTGDYTYAYLRPYTKTTLTNCNFSEGFKIDAGKAIDKITFIDCKLNGVLITAENVENILDGESSGDVTIQNTSNN